MRAVEAHPMHIIIRGMIYKNGCCLSHTNAHNYENDYKNGLFTVLYIT